MKNNYTKQQIEEILNVLTNPEEFQEFIRKMYELCNHKETECPENGYFFAPITDDVYEAIYLYKHPEEAKKKYQEIEDILNSEMARRIAEEEQMIEEGIANEESYEWYDSLTPKQLEEYTLTGNITK